MRGRSHSRRLEVVARQFVWCARNPRVARDRLIVRRDAARFARRYPFLRRRLGLSSGAGRALVVSLTDFPYQLKVEGMLLKALELNGLRPTVLTSGGAEPRARRYFSAFGVEDIIVLEDWIGGDEKPIREATDGDAPSP